MSVVELFIVLRYISFGSNIEEVGKCHKLFMPNGLGGVTKQIYINEVRNIVK